MIGSAHGGVGLRHVKRAEVESLAMTMPPLTEQRRITAIVAEKMAAVERARVATEAQIKAAKALPAAYLRAEFESEEAQQWPRVRLTEVLLDVRNGIYKPDEFYGTGTRILKMFNIGRMDGTWSLSRIDKVRLGHEEERLYVLHPGDILMNRVNSRELVGKCAVVDYFAAGAVFESKNMRLRLNLAMAFPTYVAAFLNSAYGRQQIDQRVRQIVGQATINRSDLDSIEIPLPTVDEQARHASRLGSRFAMAADLNRRLDERLADMKALSPALLRGAFSGKL